MQFTLHKINGINPYIDYEELEQSFITKLQKTCSEAEVFVLNNFPVAVSPQVNIDFVIIIHIPNVPRNYYKAKYEEGEVNVKNQIIAFSVINDYAKKKITVKGSEVEVEGTIFSLGEDAKKIKWGLTNFFSNSCSLERKHITVHPVIWFKNKNAVQTEKNFLITDKLTYQEIEKVISKNYFFKWQGYKDWIKSDVLFEHHIKSIFEQASLESKEGYITKKKINRLQNKFDKASQKGYDNIGKVLVEVSGKAGTGKSSNLLKWMLQNSLNGKRGVFLTYNHLLCYDISYQVQTFRNRYKDSTQIGSLSVNTLHSFFYNIAKKLGVLILMSKSRIKYLENVLDERLEIIRKYFENQKQLENNLSLAKLLMLVQSKWQIDEGVKREAISLIHYLQKSEKFLPNPQNIEILISNFREKKIKELSSLESSNVFIKDYHKVLERILLAAQDPGRFIDEMNVTEEYDILSIEMNLNSEYQNDKTGKMDYQMLKARYKKGLSGFRAGRIVYVDEAQDCHPLERDIIYNLFNSENVVIANGGKEQLIRYSNLCDWHISQNTPIKFYRYSKKPKSFRMKPAIAALANHIANHYNIELDIEPLDTEDTGNITIDTRYNSNELIFEEIKKLNRLGELQGCNDYESLILLRPPNESNSKNSKNIEDSVVINEYNNIVYSRNSNKSEWDIIKVAKDKVDGIYFWDASNTDNKKKLSHPGALSTRSIYYESCRGVEAWSIICFAIDRFFEAKKNEEEADNYQLDTLFDQLNPEERREMFAATWVLMAVTRCIENCYLQLQDPSSSLFLCIAEFASKNPNIVTIKE